MLNGGPFMQISHCSTASVFLKQHLCYLMISIMSINAFLYPENINFDTKIAFLMVLDPDIQAKLITAEWQSCYAN